MSKGAVEQLEERVKRLEQRGYVSTGFNGLCYELSYGGVTLSREVTGAGEDRFGIPSGGKSWIARQADKEEQMHETKLREAIQMVRDLFGPSDQMGTIGMWGAGQLILSAAESTLPKLKIVNVIEGSGRSKAPYTRTYETGEEALMHSCIDCLRADGFALIKVTTKEVPAD